MLYISNVELFILYKIKRYPQFETNLWSHQKSKSPSLRPFNSFGRSNWENGTIQEVSEAEHVSSLSSWKRQLNSFRICPCNHSVYFVLKLSEIVTQIMKWYNRYLCQLRPIVLVFRTNNQEQQQASHDWENKLIYGQKSMAINTTKGDFSQRPHQNCLTKKLMW